MRKLKLKKLTAVILIISILAGVVTVCMSIFAGAASDSLIIGGGFESTYGMWNNVTQNTNGRDGYTNLYIGVDQHNTVAEGWFGTNGRGTRIWLDHTTDSKEGNYALKFNIPSDSDTVPATIYPKVSAVNISALTDKGAYYKLTAWVKGTNNKSYIEVKTVDGSIYKQSISVDQIWHRVELDGIFLSKTTTLATLNSDKGYHIKFVVEKDASEQTELYLDNVRLTLTDNVIIDGGLETAETVGFSKYVGRGQTNALTKTFLGYHEYEGAKEQAGILVTHTAAGRSGYALHFEMPATSGTRLTVFPYENAHNFSSVNEGYYTLSFWVKSTSSKAKLVVETTDNTYEADVPVAMEWTKVKVDNIYFEDGAANLITYRPDTNEGRKAGYAIKLIMETVADYATELMVDDIAFTPIEFFTNADFENGVSGWVSKSETGAVAQSVELSNVKSGKCALKLDMPAKSDIIVSEVALPKEGFVRGYYMLAFWAKGNGSLSAQTIQGKDEANLDCTLSNEWQLFVAKDIVIDSGVLNSLKFVAKNNDDTAHKIYIDNVQLYRQVGPGNYIDVLTAKINNKGKLQLTIPPEGYAVTVLSSSDESIIALDGNVTLPAVATTVDVVLKMTNINDETDTAKSEVITVDVPSASGGDENIVEESIIKGDFEDSTVKLKTISDGVTYNDVIGRGQENTITDGWKGFNWWQDDKATNAPRFSISSGRNGGSALRIDSPAGQKDSSVFIYPTSDNFNKSVMLGGKYKFSMWVKGTNTNSKNNITISALEADGVTTHDYTATITAGEEWHQITIEDIYITPHGENLQNITVNGAGRSPLVIQIKGVSGTATYLDIDDIIIERTGDTGVLKDNMILQNGSFERNGIGEWHFTDKVFPNNQCNYIIEGWRANQWNDSSIKIAASHVDDAQDGKYALKFDIPASANTLTMLPDTTAVDTTKVTEGFYNLTFYTKGTNVKSVLKVGTASSYGSNQPKEYTVNIAPSLEWQKVTIEGIYLTDNAANLANANCAWDQGVKPSNTKQISFTLKADIQGTVIYIDNIILEKDETLIPTDGNMFSNASFEDASTRGVGFENYVPISGQNQVLADGWYDYSWNGSKYVTHTTENVHSGTYALKVAYKADTERICPGIDNITGLTENNGTYILPAGTYELSVWVRGNAPVQIIMPNDKRSAIVTPASTEVWQQVTQTITYDTDVTLPTTKSRAGKGPLFTNSMGVIIQKGTAGTYVVIDDISFTKVS